MLMMTSGSEFWGERLQKHGHTGWADPTIYAYDQGERLAILSAELDALELQPKVALDFGCGTGDFSRLLLDKGYQVFGYDPYVEPKIKDANFRYIAQHDQLEEIAEVSLILSVTVFDHILDRDALSYELKLLHNKASQNCQMLMVEYALDQAAPVTNEYQAFRTVQLWTDILGASGWDVAQVKPIPHPVRAPSAGCVQYSSHLGVRLARKLSRISHFKPILVPIIANYAGRQQRQFGVGCVSHSPLKLLRCTPRSASGFTA
jgi:hypothetical protein